MAHMVRVQPGPALRRAAGRGEYIHRPSIGALQSRGMATNAAIREPSVDYPVQTPQPRNVLERKAAIKNAKPFSDFLTDTFNRQHDYLRISITERCNLRCLYCMPEEGIPLSPPANMLTTPEIFYLSSLFVSQGVTKIRLTGGEPTIRRDIVPMMQQIGSLRPKGLRELALTTNGIALHRKLDAMVEAGLTGVNLSLDTLDPFQFQIMTRRKGFDAVMKSIDRILEMNKLGANVRLKVNCVVMRGLNEREILPFVEMGREKDIEVRFIEYMPFGGNKWSENKMISFQEMLDIIRTKYPGLRSVQGHKNDTSKTYEVPGFVGRVGFITSMTNDFCGSCNRLRITSDGNLKVCLHGNAEVSLRDLLRQGNGGEPIDQEAFERIRQIEMDRHEGRLSDETILGWGQRERELLEMIGIAVKKKAEKHADLNDLANMENRPMILIDRSISLPSPSARWHSIAHPTLNTHNTPSLLHGGFSSRPGSHTHLFSSASQTLASIRAFSTTPTSRAKNKYKKTEWRKGLDDVNTPQGRKRLLNSLEREIKVLERRIAVEKSQDLATDPGDWESFLESTIGKMDAGLKSKAERKAKRALWLELKRAAELAKERAKSEPERQQLRDEHEKEISELEAVLAGYKARIEILRASSEDIDKLYDLRKQKGETLARKYKLLHQLEQATKAAQYATMTGGITVEKKRETRESDGLLDMLDVAVSKTKRASRSLQGHDLPASPVYGHQSARTSRNQSSEQLHDRRRAHVTKREDIIQGPETGELQTLSEHATVFGSMNKPSPIPPSWPLSQRPLDIQSTSLQPPSSSHNSQTSSAPQRKLSDDLRLRVPDSGVIPIDSELIADFEAPVAHLQSQIYQMQQRLKSSYPRIDTLPYDIGTSENPKTLQTWLKVLVSRWQTRFAGDNSSNEEKKTSDVGDNVKSVLDQMVRDHDLSNEAAKRMAKRWREIFEARVVLSRDAVDVLDKDELDAGGMGFLREEPESQYADVQTPSKERVTSRVQNKGSLGYGGTGTLSSESLTRRLYSTSTRPPLDPELSPLSLNDDARTTASNLPQEATQPSLPHLTSSGSAHMVSVSAKAHTVRTAIAVGTVYFSNATPLSLIRSNSLKKGDVLSVSRIAGIMAAKKCPDLIPLCHPIALTNVGVELKVFNTMPGEGMGFGGVAVEAKVQCTGPTGVEMEALTAIMGAALSVVDMCKAVDKFQRVQDVRVVLKEGGKSGIWREEGWVSFQSKQGE